MEYNYRLETFVSTPNTGDKRITIYDKNGGFTNSIDPTTISHTYVKNNCLIIKITNKNDVSLTFETSDIAKSALLKLDTIRKSFNDVVYSSVIYTSVPDTITSKGEVGQVAYDSVYWYVCISTDTWKRSPLSDW